MKKKIIIINNKIKPGEKINRDLYLNMVADKEN